MKNDVITVEAHEETLEAQIDTALQKENVTTKVIAALKKKYGGLQLKSVDDKEGYCIIKESRKEVRKIGIIVEKICEEGRSDAVKIQRLWIAKQKEVLGQIAEVQDPLDAEIKKYDDEQARLEAEELQRQEERFMTRQSQLLKMGAVYANGCFNLNDVSYESNMIKEADGEIYSDTILPKYTAAYEKNEAVRVAEEKKKEAEAIELKRQQDEFAEKQKLFNEEQERFKQQQAELQKQKDEAARQEKEKRDALVKARCVRLEGLNMSYSYQTDIYSFDTVKVSKALISEADDTAFEKLVQEITPQVEERKQVLFKQQEEKRLFEIEAAQQKVIREEQERAAEEQRVAKIKAEQEEAKRLEELSKASDKEKWETLMLEVNAIVLPEFKSGIYKGKLNSLKQKFEEINSL